MDILYLSHSSYLVILFAAFLQPMQTKRKKEKKKRTEVIRWTQTHHSNITPYSTVCGELRGRQKVTERHKHHSAYCYSVEWSSGTSIPHSGTMCSRIISSIKVHLLFTLPYTQAAQGHNVLLFFYISLLLTYNFMLEDEH